MVGSLPAAEVGLLAALDLRPGRVTPRRRLTSVVGDDALDRTLRSLRRSLRPCGIELVDTGAGDVVFTRMSPLVGDQPVGVVAPA